ncbi:MAG: TonB-dependent receptor [Desulfococcaceae bacterium]|jgi:iron complex outermembrane receptor protein|nr:TonB-dependent receptor [Desulfococcaceae bacterium]
MMRFAPLLKSVMAILCLPGFLFAAPPGFAEESAQEKKDTLLLDEITVTASPVIEGKALDAFAGQKTVVSEEQIRDLNAQDIGTALRRTPGVNISRYNLIGSFGGGSGGAVFIRGMGSSRPGAEIKTLVDGIPMYMSVWNHPLLDLMSIDSAQSVEVYKSPQPHIFGNAFGVVNIVPRQMETQGYVSKGEIAGGSHSTFIGKAEHGGRQENFDYYLGGGYRKSDGHRDNSDGEIQDLHGRVGYRFSDQWHLSWFSLWNDNYADDPGAEGADISQLQGRYETGAWMNVITLENRSDRAEGHLKLYRNEGEGNWLDQPTDTPGLKEDLFNDFLFYGLKARESFRMWEGGEIVCGFDWDVTEGEYDAKFSDGTRESWDGHDFTIVSPYMAFSQQFGSKDGFYVTPSAGVRYYDHSDFDAQWSPHAGILLGYGDTELHAGYSRGVIYPGLDVVVFSEKVIPALGQSWKDLDAETADHYEIGLRHHFGSLAIADLTLFYNEGKNRYVIVPPPPPPPVYANIEKYRIQGVETALHLYPAENFSLFTGLTWLDTKPSDLPYAPDFTFSAGVNWRFLKVFSLSLDCQYADEMFTDSQARRKDAQNANPADSYFLLNGKLACEFDSGGKLKGEIYAAGENLTDADYEYQPGYPMPGISAMAGIRFSF